MTTQEDINMLTNMVELATKELITMQNILISMTKILIQQKDGQGENALGKNALTVEEKAKLLEEGICPDCDSKTFDRGPEGGLSTNIRCVDCGSKFNVCPPYFAERI